ncbi:MAG: EI24 domain-containing protein [Gemmataceae bacterium]
MPRADVAVPLALPEGAYAFVRGVGFILTTPSAWFHAAVPVVTALVLACGLSGASLPLARQAATWLLPGETATSQAGGWAVTLILALFFILMAALLALVLAQPLSGWALEAIARNQEQRLTGSAPPEPGFLRSILVGLRCSLFILVASLVTTALLLSVTLVFPPTAVVTVPLKVLTAGCYLAWDLTDYPLGLRGLGIGARLGWAWRNLGAFTLFGVCWALVLVVPGVFLLVLPMGVAGATCLVVASEQRQIPDALPA